MANTASAQSAARAAAKRVECEAMHSISEVNLLIAKIYPMGVSALNEFIDTMPKAELHVHLEGTLEPDLSFELARKNGVELPYD